MMGYFKENKRDKKFKSKKIEEDKDEYVASQSSDTESMDLLASDDEDFGNKKNTKKEVINKKRLKRIKKTPAQKAAIEQKKRQDAEELDRRLNADYVDSGIRIVKTRIADDGISEEVVEIDPTIKEIRPKKWKVIQETPTDLPDIDNHLTTLSRKIIHACITNDVDLAHECIQEAVAVSLFLQLYSEPESLNSFIE